MNTCKTCKWWGKPFKLDIHCDILEQFRECGNPRFVYGQSPLDIDNPVTLEDCMYSVVDEFGDDSVPEKGEATTGPDFGCIHHEPKEEL